MSIFLGLDTSNYTTSAALFDDADGRIRSSRRLLDVKKGSLGLRQSDALFMHVLHLPDRIRALEASGAMQNLAAVAASDRPRAVEGSYMPCFLAGCSHAKALSALLGVPFYAFSHQQGHLAAGIHSAGRPDLFERPFLALHVSGGTTELLHVDHPDGHLLNAVRIGGTEDLAAGQLIDRCGNRLNLPFPSGPALEKLAGEGGAGDFFLPKSRGTEFSLSGLENKMGNLIDRGENASIIANFVIKSIIEILSLAIARAQQTHAGLPLLCVGGVMSNRLIKTTLEDRFGAVFAEPEYSSDNAAGTALLCSIAHKRGEPANW